MKGAPETRHSLLARLHGSDNDGAWTEFVTLYEPAIYRFARRQGLQDADAREIVQEVLLNVRSLALKPPSNKMERFRAWLATVARNRVIDLVRKKARKERPLAHLQDRAIANNNEGFSYEIRHQMFVIASQKVQRQVSAAQWQAFWQTAVEVAPAHEVAKRLGMSLGNVYVTRCRVMEKLRYEIDRMTHEELENGELEKGELEKGEHS